MLFYSIKQKAKVFESLDGFFKIESSLSPDCLHGNSRLIFSLKGGDPAAPSDTATLLWLHPSRWFYLRQLSPLRVNSPASGPPNSHGVTGGVYKTRERIHPDILIRNY